MEQLNGVNLSNFSMYYSEGGGLTASEHKMQMSKKDSDFSNVPVYIFGIDNEQLALLPKDYSVLYGFVLINA